MKNKNLTDSFNNAVNGILYTVRNERNMKIHIVIAALVMLLSLFYNLTRIEYLVVFITIAIVIICELFNTAIEILVDTIIDIYHPKAKLVKDTAAGAVMVSAFVSLLVAYFVFFDRVSTSLETGIVRIKQAPMLITVISLILTIISVIFIKTFSKRGTPFSGGMPSGHSAVAFAATTAVALWTNNISITLLMLVVSLLVIQSRLEGKIHTVIELLAGAVIGFAVTLLLFQLYRGYGI